MCKLVLLDIDGTVMSHKTNPSSIPEATREAVRLLVQAGHTVAFATGRSHATARMPMEELGIRHAVLSNGAHIVSGGATAFIQYLDRHAAGKASRHVISMGYPAYAADGDFVFACNASEDSLSYLRAQCGSGEFLRTFSEMGDICKFEYYGEVRLKGISGKRADMLDAYGGVEMRPPGTSKEQGIRRFAEITGFSMKDTVAVGDGENDIGMLKEAAMGIAVGGATQAAKAAADIVADKIEDGGIYKVFRQLGLI